MRWSRCGTALQLIVTVLAQGCEKPAMVVHEETPRAARTAPAPSAAVPIDSFGARGRLDIVPRIAPFAMGMMDHAFVVGWAAAGTTLVECHSGMVTSCEFVPVDGKTEQLRVEPDDTARAQKEIALKARAKAMGIGTVAGEWAYARDLEVTWQVIVGSQVTKPPIPGVLKVGARVRGENPSFAIVLSETSTGYHDRIHPEVIALSPDGKYLGVFAHAFSGEYGDTFPVAIVAVGRLAAQAYSAAGFSEKATAADPTFVPTVRGTK